MFSSRPPPKYPLLLELDAHELRMILHGLVCERDALRKSLLASKTMPHFQTYIEGKVVLYERLIERITLVR